MRGPDRKVGPFAFGDFCWASAGSLRDPDPLGQMIVWPRPGFAPIRSDYTGSWVVDLTSSSTA
jgi:hypothetical protein